MAFEKEIHLKDCPYSYAISDQIKKYTLRDTTFVQERLGHYKLTRLLEEVPNSGKGFPLNITIKEDLSAFKLSITDQSGLRLVNIFKSEDHKIYQDKFFFLMDSLVDRGIFTKQPK